MRDTVYGEVGVLAYDADADRVQCAACGRWYQKLTSQHLMRHGLSISAYKERYGLNSRTALETPRITALRRRQVEESGATERLVPYHREKGGPPLSEDQGYQRRAQYRRTYETPERLQERGRRRRRWSDEEMLSALRTAQAEAGGVLTRHYLTRHRPGARGLLPSASAVVKRFGSWRCVCELLGQPDPQRKGTVRQWTDEAILSALRRLEAELGRPLTARHLYQLRTGHKGQVGAFPSYKTVHDRFGSWRRVRDLLARPSAADEGAGGRADR
jgi:hypothetical protein